MRHATLRAVLTGVSGGLTGGNCTGDCTEMGGGGSTVTGPCCCLLQLWSCCEATPCWLTMPITYVDRLLKLLAARLPSKPQGQLFRAV